MKVRTLIHNAKTGIDTYEDVEITVNNPAPSMPVSETEKLKQLLKQKGIISDADINEV